MRSAGIPSARIQVLGYPSPHEHVRALALDLQIRLFGEQVHEGLWIGGSENSVVLVRVRRYALELQLRVPIVTVEFRHHVLEPGIVEDETPLPPGTAFATTASGL